MGATESKIAADDEEGIVTVAAAEANPDTLDPLLLQLQDLEHSLPILEHSLGEGWRDLQRLYVGRGLTLDAQALRDLVKTYQEYCKGHARSVVKAQAHIHTLIGASEKEAETVMQMVSRAISQANMAAANLSSVTAVAAQVAKLGQRMSQLQTSLEDLSRQVEQLSLSRAAPPR